MKCSEKLLGDQITFSTHEKLWWMRMRPILMVCERQWESLSCCPNWLADSSISKTIYQLKKNLVSQEHRQQFVDCCLDLCKVATVDGNNLLKEQLNVFCQMHPTLKTWVDWWHARRSHTFPPSEDLDLLR